MRSMTSPHFDCRLVPPEGAHSRTYDDVEGDAEGQFVWASVYELPQIHQLKPGVGYAADTCTEPGALRPGELPARVCNIRRYVGNGTDLNQISPEQLAWIEHRINTTPRRSLNWDTANDVYHRLSAPTT